MIWTPDQKYLNDPFETEAQLEAAITDVADILFGLGRIYLDVKKLVGAKGKIKNIPDGYLIDLTSKRDPRLFVVENELASHDPLNHVAVQVLEFSLSFQTSPFKLKGILKDALKARPDAHKMCEKYATANGFENVDYLLERMLQKDNAFNALVIIDELEEELETLLLSRFKFPVEILTLQRFRTADGQKAYQFDPFLADLSVPAVTTSGKVVKPEDQMDPSELDTVVVPAQEEGFKEVFVGENRWYAIRIHSSMVPRIKYIAAYRTAPVSAITSIAPVKDIALWKDGSKYVLNFTEPAKEIGPIKLVPKPNGIVKAPQGPRYTSYKKLTKASNLDEAFTINI
jgi:hypothetical protein